MRLKIILSVCLFVGLMFDGKSQSEYPSNSHLNKQFNYILDESRSYGAYKAISNEKLNLFNNQLSDSLKKYHQKISLLNAEKYDLIGRNEKLQKQTQSLETELAASEKLNDSIAFLGMDVSKSTYNIILWSIITLLIVGIIGTYMVCRQWYLSGKSLEKESVKLNKELAELREKKLEKEIRLKRELQTALNKLEKVKNNEGITVR